MSRRWKIVALVALAVAILFVLTVAAASCGGDGSAL